MVENATRSSAVFVPGPRKGVEVGPFITIGNWKLLNITHERELPRRAEFFKKCYDTDHIFVETTMKKQECELVPPLERRPALRLAPHPNEPLLLGQTGRGRQLVHDRWQCGTV